MFVMCEFVGDGEAEEVEDAKPVRIPPAIDTSYLPECPFFKVWLAKDQALRAKRPVQPFF